MRKVKIYVIIKHECMLKLTVCMNALMIVLSLEKNHELLH
jgi:hypothetical protein